MKQLNVRLDDELYEKIRRRCFEQRISMTSYAVKQLEDGLRPREVVPKLVCAVPDKWPTVPKPFDNTSLSKAHQVRKVKK